MALTASSVLGGLYKAVLRPEALVQTQTAGAVSVRERLGQLRELTAVYLLNLGLYAGPLTLAGFGRQAVPARPEWLTRVAVIGDSTAVWQLSYAFVQNSLFLFSATILTLLTLHLILIVTRQSRGFVKSAHVIIYSTSVYLAGIFTAVWYLSTASGLGAARQFVIDVQRLFIYAIIDALGADVGLPGGRPGEIRVADLSATGEAVVVLLVLLGCYYFYSLYLGIRINHETDRVASLVAIAGVAASPVVYIALSVLAATSDVIPAI